MSRARRVDEIRVAADGRPSPLPICAHSSECVNLVRGKSAWPTSTTWVFAASLRSAELCSTRALSRWNGLRS